MKKIATLALAAALSCAASAQETPVSIALSGWTGFAPLTLAKEAGIFKKNGLDVSLKKVPQKDRHLERLCAQNIFGRPADHVQVGCRFAAPPRFSL